MPRIKAKSAAVKPGTAFFYASLFVVLQYGTPKRRKKDSA